MLVYILNSFTTLSINLGSIIRIKNLSSFKSLSYSSFETGVFHESYKYAKNFDLPFQFVVEDNNLSVHTPTDAAWGVKQEVPDDVVYYTYENGYPHHGTGAWVNF